MIGVILEFQLIRGQEGGGGPRVQNPALLTDSSWAEVQEEEGGKSFFWYVPSTAPEYQI